MYGVYYTGDGRKALHLRYTPAKADEFIRRYGSRGISVRNTTGYKHVIVMGTDADIERALRIAGFLDNDSMVPA
jgi:hypothetical protein